MSKKLKNTTEKLNLLFSQSSNAYQLLKDEVQKLYYIRRVKDMRVALIGDSDEAEWFILYGIDANKEDLRNLKFV